MRSMTFPIVMVAHAEQCRVLHAQMSTSSGDSPHPAVVGPVEVRALRTMRIERLVVLLGEEGLVRVEGLDLQEPVVVVAVAAQKVFGHGEGLRLRLQTLSCMKAAVDPVLTPHRAVYPRVGHRFRYVGFGDLAHPGVALLAARELPAVVALVVGRAAVLEVMVVVGDEVRVNAAVLQQFRHRVVEGFQRPPAAVQEVVAPGVQFTARRHAGHAAHVAAVEVTERCARRAKLGAWVQSQP